MLDIKQLLEQTGMKVKEGGWRSPPPLPYLVFTEKVTVGGADYLNCIKTHDVSIYLYSEQIDKTAQKKIERLLDGINAEYVKYTIWIDSEKFWQTAYEFEFIEKIREE